MAKEVLVAFGTRHESTRGIAAAVADILRAAGIAVELVPVSSVGSLSHVRAAVLGSAVYDGGWLPGAYEFLRRARTGSGLDPDLAVRLRAPGPRPARREVGRSRRPRRA